MSLQHSCIRLSLTFPAGLGPCMWQWRVLFYINNTITAVCEVLGHQAVLALEAVYKHATVELLASLQQMTNWFIIMIQILLYSLLTHMYGSCWRIVAVLTEIIWNALNTMLCCRVQIEHQHFFISVARSIVVIVHASKDFLFMKSLMDETNTKVQYKKTQIQCTLL